MMVLTATPATPVGQTFLFWRAAVPSNYLESNTYYRRPKIPYHGLGDSWVQSIQSIDPLQLDFEHSDVSNAAKRVTPLPTGDCSNTILDAVEKDHAGTTWNYNSLTGCIA